MSPLSVDDIYAQVDKDGKEAQTIPMPVFLGTVFVGIPIWLTVVLPLTIVYQIGAKIASPLSAKPQSEIAPPPNEVDTSNLIPRKDRAYDVVLLGATGFTGGLAAKYLAKTYGVGKQVTWAIAGRSASKLDAVKRSIAKELGNDDALKIDTLIVDTDDLSTLPTLVQNTRAVITTAGPFEKYGSNVVEFCAKYGTHYVDITGEAEWVKHMILKWDATAQRTGAKLVCMCGHDSVPWDLTVMKLEQELPEGEELVSVDCFNELIAAASGGTLATVIMGLEGESLPAPKHDFDPLLMLPDGSKSSASVKPIFSFPVTQTTPLHGRHASSYSIFFPMSVVNAALITRSAALRQASKKYTYKEVQVVPDFKTGFVTLFGIVGLITCLLNPITAYPVKKFLLPQPGQGPSADDMENKNFLLISGHGVGSRGTIVQSVIYYPRDAGYLDTARMVTESGLALALDAAKLPSGERGGYFTPSTGMGQVLLDRLCATGTYFASRVISKTPK